ncbi:MAG: HIT domain-containing protein [Actinomycetota bacterium]|nr:HIT domain-containing protein [Actinomycetota bacterium]
MADAETVEQCLFCRIARGEVPATVVRESERTLTFRDIDPQAPTHLLVIPRDHHVDIGALAAVDPQLLGELVTEAAQAAADAGLHSHRLVFNSGAGAGQSVFHVHGHLLGGRPLRWPPG